MINKIMGNPYVNEIIGMELDKAIDHLSKHDMTLRVIEEDGISKMVKYSIDMNRVNVFVRNGIVTNLDKLG